MYATITITQAQKESKAIDLSVFPNFSATGSIKGMKKLYYGKDALLIKCGRTIYKVTPEIYNLFK